ncbi:hypothetical protein Dsin_011653 [Dipteronia sinensis]|uniref:RNase H type-1 domain-containing protein n=1 Tax=Dipteronia sinensis TaxID=43782 RepID=A0AAE0AH07_9ROSI|nr:hypothetical protein Dsin_011653 [Dipteronia sinensis]
MVAMLSKRYEGKWPFWLSPHKAIICPMSSEFDAYAKQVTIGIWLLCFRSATKGSGPFGSVSIKSSFFPCLMRLILMQKENLRHLFLDCPFVLGLWDVVSSTFGHKLKLDGTCLNLWQETMRVVFTTQLKALWRVDSLQSGTMKTSVDELQTLHRLHVSGRPPKAPRILEVNWHPPPLGCLKVNTDEAAFGSPGLAGCAGVFRTCRGFVKGCFVIPIGVCFAFKAELATAVHAIDYAWTFGWRRLWLESDSTFVVDALRSKSRKVP